MGKKLQIGIAGCGIAGLSAAILLHRQGHRVRVFDQFATPLPVGSGLVIQPVGQAVLAELGVLEAALARGARINRMVGRVAGSGRIALDAGYGTRFGLALHRSSLFAALLEQAQAEGVEVVPSSRVVSGRTGWLVIEGRGDAGPFDLVVDASGARSPLSSQPGRLLPYGALWATVDWPLGVPEHATELRQVYQAARHMLGVLPVGTLPGDSRRKAAIFWSLRQNRYDAWRAAPIADWKRQAAGLWPEFAPFAAGIQDHGQMTMARYRHGALRNPARDRLVHIGDAWHVASPQLGQGANMALLDAFALSLALTEQDEVNEALVRFHGLRRRHLGFYQAMSWLFTPMYQSDSSILPLLRDRVLMPVAALPAVRLVVSRLLAGDLVPPLARRALPSPQTSG